MRISKEEYLMNIAIEVSKRSTCPDAAVGCVIASEDGYILSTGYNGVRKGEKHCRVKDGKCLDNGPNHAVNHAEVNSVASAARFGTKLDGSIAYVTHKPCIKCEGILFQAGIKKIIVLKK